MSGLNLDLRGCSKFTFYLIGTVADPLLLEDNASAEFTALGIGLLATRVCQHIDSGEYRLSIWLRSDKEAERSRAQIEAAFARASQIQVRQIKINPPWPQLV
jgi:hypothetical protein